MSASGISPRAYSPRSPRSGRDQVAAVRSAAAAADRELVLGVADALLELPRIRGRLAALDLLELGLRLLELPLGTLGVDLGGRDGVVDERDRTILEHLEEPRAR